MGSDDIKKIEISKNKRLRESRKLARKTSNRQFIPKILILTEGISEEIYFSSLRRALKLNTVIVKKSTHTDSIGIVRDAMKRGEDSINEKDEFNLIFCIFDLDTVENRRFLSCIESYNSRNIKTNSVIHPIFSFPCIEFWFILHYQCHNAPFVKNRNNSVGDNVKKELKKYRPDYNEANSQCINDFSLMYKTAIHNANKVIGQQLKCDSNNPITNIHQLMTLLESIYKRTNNYEYIKPLDAFILGKI